MLDLYSRTGKGKLVETVGEYEIRQINPVVTDHEGQLIPYSYIVVAPDESAKDSGIVLPDQVNLGKPVVAICQTKQLAQEVISFLTAAESVVDGAPHAAQTASRH